MALDAMPSQVKSACYDVSLLVQKRGRGNRYMLLYEDPVLMGSGSTPTYVADAESIPCRRDGEEFPRA